MSSFSALSHLQINFAFRRSFALGAGMNERFTHSHPQSSGLHTVCGPSFRPLAVHPLWWFLHLAKTWVFPSCTFFFSPFFGRFYFLVTIGKFSSFITIFSLDWTYSPIISWGYLLGLFEGVFASLGVLFWEGSGFEGTSPSKFGNEFGGSLRHFFGVFNQAGFGAVWGT
jgi:hypothetical protein